MKKRLTGSLPALVAAAVIGLSTLAPMAHAQDNTLIIARDMDFDSLDPHRSWCDSCQIYNTAAYQTLTTLDAENTVVPLLAESWEVNDEQTVFTFKINPDARFADGRKVEAKDVKWSVERLQNLKSNSSFYVSGVDSVEAPDSETTIITLKSPNSEFLEVLASGSISIINSELAMEHGAVADETAATADSSEAWFLTNSAGSGAFTLTSYEPSSELRLTRNENYWREKPTSSEVVMRQVKDAVAQAQMLQSGAVDIAMQIDPETAKTLTGDDLVVETVPSFNFIYVAISPSVLDLEYELTPKVRQAISYAIDRESLIDFTLSGAGRPLSAPIPLGFPGSEGHEATPYDPELAKQMLTEEGLGDGVTMRAIYPDYNVYGVDLSLMFQKIAQDLKKVDIELELEPSTIPNWRETMAKTGVPLTAAWYAPDFLATSPYVDYFGLGPQSVWALRAGMERDPSVANHEIMKLHDKALATSDPVESEAIWTEAAEMMIDERVIFPMVSPDLVLAYRKGVEGVRYSICCNLLLEDVKN